MKKRKERRKGQAQHGQGAVRYSATSDQSGVVQLQLRVDFRFARPPETYYYADALSISVDQEMGVAILAFARTKPEGGLRDRLDVVMPEVSLFGGFLSSAVPLEPAIDQQLQMLKLHPTARTIGGVIPSRGTLYANLIFVSTGGAESCLDFYYLPVRDVHFAKTNVGSEISLQPVVRIPTSPVLLKHMLNLCREFAAKLQSRVDPKRSSERVKERAKVS
jgi:hypothetical protein